MSPWLLRLLFSSHLARSKYNIPRSINHKPQQARFKWNIPRSISHKPQQARYKYNIPRSKNRGLSDRKAPETIRKRKTF